MFSKHFEIGSSFQGGIQSNDTMFDRRCLFPAKISEVTKIWERGRQNLLMAFFDA